MEKPNVRCCVFGFIYIEECARYLRRKNCAIFTWLVLEIVSEVRLHKKIIFVNALSGTTLQSKHSSFEII